MTCVAPRCLMLGCFPTLREVLDALWEFLKTALAVIGAILLAILLAIIFRGLRRLPTLEPTPFGEPILAAEESGGGQLEPAASEA
jgi:hypothetical protein